MTEATRVLLVDDHAILRAGLRLLIEHQTDLTVVGEAGSGAAVLEMARTLQPDLILLDLSLPDSNSLTLIPTLREMAPASRILILTMHDDAGYLRQALDAGAAGYVLKSAVDQELILAIRAVQHGETYVHSSMTQKLLDSLHTPPEREIADPWHSLSAREFGVMRLVALGHTNTEIADKLHLSVKTVETYRARGMAKLALHTRAQLVQSALRYGHLE